MSAQSWGLLSGVSLLIVLMVVGIARLDGEDLMLDHKGLIAQARDAALREDVGAPVDRGDLVRIMGDLRELAEIYASEIARTESATVDLADGEDEARRAVIWLLSDDTGRSSKSILRHMLSLEGDSFFAPLDSGDFGRCHRLLQSFPTWRARIGEMDSHESWAPLVARWDELERLYVDGARTELTARLSAAGDAWLVTLKAPEVTS